MGEEKKTQMGTAGRAARVTGSPPIATPSASAVMPVAAAGTPAPTAEDIASSKAKTSYLQQPPDPLIGTAIAGRYKIVRKLGEGGMGSVYLAMHTILEKEMALKVLHVELARKEDLVERFMQEAKAASRIRHANVIEISDFGVTDDGYVFFAMEVLKGHDLHDEITRAKLAGNLLPWSRTKKIFLQICSALSAAHSRGIIHRDLKPENIYLVDFLGEPDFVKLLDFGIAKVTDISGATDEGARKLTKTGMLFGTPEYMSPEQARGDKVDHRVDVYAMGCILFQMVTNSVPFKAENFMGVLSQHLTEEPPAIAPEVFDRIGAPRALADVIDKALTKDRDVRYQTMDELVAAIREVSGDPAASDTSVKMRAASVPSPAETTRQRPPTGQVEPQRSRTPTGAARSKTAWTGNLSVPEEGIEEAPVKKPSSKVPLIAGAVLLAGGAAVAAFVLTRDKGGAGPAPVVAIGSGSATVVAPPPPQPPQPPPEPPLPTMATIAFATTPKGAQVVDVADGTSYGKTPTTFTLPGSRAPRRFKFVLKGYGDAVVELVPNRERIEFKQDLVRGATKGEAVVVRVPDPTLKPEGTPAGTTAVTTASVPPTGSATTTPSGSATTMQSQTPTGTLPTPPPPTGSATEAKPDPKPEPKPDTQTGSATTPPPDPKPDLKPKNDDCKDDDLPCLKVDPSRSP